MDKVIILTERPYMLCTSKSSLVFIRHRVANDMMSMKDTKVLGPPIAFYKTMEHVLVEMGHPYTLL